MKFVPRTFSLGQIAALSMVLSMDSSALADVLATYGFGSPGNETTIETSPFFAATATADRVIATPITDPAATIGIEISSAATVPVNAPFLRIDPQGNSATADMAFTNNKYFQFTLSANAGSRLDLSSLDFNVARGGASTPRGFAVRSDADGYAATILSLDVPTARPTYTPVSIPLGAATFQDRSSITFRIYPYSTGGGASVDFDDFVVNGIVEAVPEPVSFSLLGFGAIGVALQRRR